MTLLLICFFVFLVLGMPVAFVIGIAGLAFFSSVEYLNYQTATQMIVSQSQSFAFLAVPFFIFAGNLMNVSGITSRLLGLARLLTRRMYGGTAQISVVLSTLMGGVSGSATADAAMETRILAPEMMRLGYSKGYICAVNCITALITATIPPSLGLIIFGFVGEVSIGRLFAAGIIPGVLMMFFLMATTTITSRVKKYDPPQANAPRFTLGELFNNLKESIWALLFPVILIVGIRFGVFTPSESGAFAVIYAVIIGVFVYKELKWENFKEALLNTLKDTGAVMLIIAMSGPFSYAITWVKLPVALSGLIFGITENPQILVLLMLGFLFISGMFVDSNVNFLLLTPHLSAHGKKRRDRPCTFWRSYGNYCNTGSYDTACRLRAVYGVWNNWLSAGGIHKGKPAFSFCGMPGNSHSCIPAQVVLFIPNMIFGP